LDRSVVDSDSGTGLEEYEETIKELQKWADVTKDAYWLLDYTKNKLKKR
jgi:HPt (histidine-containing phosphotransfer) domain-containing protein